MNIVTVLVVLVVLGLCLYLIETYIPMDPVIKTVIRVVVVLFIVLWLLSAFGILSNRSLRIGSNASSGASRAPHLPMSDVEHGARDWVYMHTGALWA